MNSTPFRRLLAAGIALTLAACGGGTDPVAPSAGTGATAGSPQVAAGTITGFGSVIVDGVTYDDSAAVVKIEDDSAAPRSGTVAGLRLGMQVELRADATGRASAVTVGSEVVGRITALATDGFTVAGQSVKVSADPASPTVFDGVSGLAGLAVNDLVEVHGKRDAAGAIVASRIERKDPSSVTVIRVAGTVASLNTAAKTFAIGGLTVQWDDATRLLPTGVTLADGQRVAVWSNVPLAGNVLTARSIVVKRHQWNASDDLRLGGFVRELNFAAKTFKVDGIAVDASAAAFSRGTAADLANGRRVRIKGTFADGTVKATEVRFVRDQGDAVVELTGAITDFAGASSFKVRGVPIDASGSGVEFRNGTAANLAAGALVRIEGDVDGNVVKPRRVEFVTTDGRSGWLFGEVQAYDPATGAFRLMNLGMRLAESATLRNADGTPAVRADFGNGDRVQVRGTFAAGVFTVAEVVFRPGVQLVIDSVEGAAYDVDLTAGAFRLNGTVVRLGPTTVFDGSRENLRNGARVEVHGTLVGGALVASRVEVRTPDGDDLARVRGVVTDFVSAADFRVAGQKVDASGATYEPAGAGPGMLANGRFVEARGTLADGVLKATKVEIR